MMHRLSTFDRLKLLTLSISLTGMLCMSLADLLPWIAFSLLAGAHAAVGLWSYDREMLGAKHAVAVILAVLCLELAASMYRTGPVVVFLVRDMIITLALVRLVMRKTSREIYQIVGISFSQCLLATIFTISPLFILGLVIMVVLIPMILFELDAHAFGTSGATGHTNRMHWALISGAIILTAGILFYVLPRPASSIIRHSIVQRNRIAFTEDVNLKRSAYERLDQDILMRIIWLYGNAPNQFYLSGSRLERVGPDGFYKNDRQGSVPINESAFTDILRIYPSLFESRNVFFPFWMHSVSPGKYAIKGSNVLFLGETPPLYDVRVNREPGPSAPGKTDLPGELGRLRNFGMRIAGVGDAAAKVRRLTRYLQTNYAYTLQRQHIPEKTSAIEWFVFSSRKGSCEHFAAALAAMIRGCGIPSRVVTGFLVTEFNTGGDYFIVRASDAHAWVEYYDTTWKAIDATPYGSRPTGMRFHILDELRFRWLRWVIQYSLDDQIRFAVTIMSAKPGINKQVENLPLYLMGLVITGALSWLFYRMYVSRSLAWYDKVRRAISRKGLSLPGNIPHEAHLEIIRQRWEALEPEFSEYLQHYLLWRFRGDTMDIKALTEKMIERVKSTPRH